MKLLKRPFVGIGVFVLIAFVILLVVPSQRNAPKEGIRIVASFYPLAHIATVVGGSFVSVEAVLPPGGEPHDYEPSPRQLANLSKGDLFIFNGGGFEPWIAKWETSTLAKPRRTLNMISELKRRGVALIDHNGKTDPHIWLDPVIFKQEVEVIRDTLIEIDPSHAAEYQANADKLFASLDELDGHLRADLQGCSKQDVIVSHEAFGYLARRYGFNAVSIAGISPDEEPSPKSLAALSSIARTKGIKYVFFETTASPRLSETIAREIGAETLVLDPLESLTVYDIQSGEDYSSVMHKNSSNLRKALSCQ